MVLLLQLSRLSEYSASIRGEPLATTSHATAAAFLTRGSTSTNVVVDLAATSRLKKPPVRIYLTKLHQRSVRGTNQGNNITLFASRRRQRVSPVHPQRYQDVDPGIIIVILDTRGDLPEVHRTNVPFCPGPFHPIWRRWAAARPGLSNSQKKMGRGLAQTITVSNVHGPANQ